MQQTMTKNTDLLTLRDLTLTRSTAKARGYNWVLDILTELPDELLEEFISLVNENGYLFGKGADEATDAIGLYRPLSGKELTPQGNCT